VFYELLSVEISKEVLLREGENPKGGQENLPPILRREALKKNTGKEREKRTSGGGFEV